MTKVTIELDLTRLDCIGAVFAIARLLEGYEDEGEIDWDKDEDFWITELPAALLRIMGALEFRLTAYHWPYSVLEPLFHDTDWKHAAGWLKKEAEELDSLRAEFKMLYDQKYPQP